MSLQGRSLPRNLAFGLGEKEPALAVIRAVLSLLALPTGSYTRLELVRPAIPTAAAAPAVPYGRDSIRHRRYGLLTRQGVALSARS